MVGPSVTSTQIANSFNKQFTNTVPHTSNKTNRKIDKQVHKLPKTTFILTTSEISAAIRNSKNNNSTGPDGISIRHLKHIGPLGLTYLTNTFNLALNTNTIPHMWKLANIIPIPKPDKDHNTGTSFRPISLLSVISMCIICIIIKDTIEIVKNIYINITSIRKINPASEDNESRFKCQQCYKITK